MNLAELTVESWDCSISQLNQSTVSLNVRIVNVNWLRIGLCWLDHIF